MNIAIYPGSFDPVTNGHLDIIQRTAAIFDKVIVSVLRNSGKNALFSVEQRVEMLKKVTCDLKNIEIDCFSGLLIDYVRSKNAHVIIKGLRAISDFEYEFQMATVNNKLAPEIETLFMMTGSRYFYLSSSIVKEVASLGGNISELVPEQIIPDVTRRISK